MLPEIVHLPNVRALIEALAKLARKDRAAAADDLIRMLRLPAAKRRALLDLIS